MRLPFLAATLGLAVSTTAHADEGMWLPMQLPQLASQMKAAGYRGDVQALADVTRPPLAAVVKAGGATGAFVSPQGLILTNHHVAFGVIQYNATKERNLIDTGYYAQNMGEELPANPDFRVLVTTGFDKVSERITGAAHGKTGRAYYSAIEAAKKAMVKECEASGEVRCSVVSMDYGSDFYLVRQLELKDIRLVYAPPKQIGAYGDVPDNFVWPRHAGDFTVLRAYVGRDGKPAEFSKDNVPYTPPAHFQVSTRAVKQGDFAMLAGYPGTTFRNRMASEFANTVLWQLPSRVALYESILADVRSAAPAGSEGAVRYASQVQSWANTLKRAQGELEGLKRSDAVRVRREDEAAMLGWLDRQPDARATRADIIAAQAVLDEAAATRERDQLFALMRTQTQLLKSALQLQRLALEHAKPDAERASGYQARDEALIEGQLKQVSRRYDAGVEKAILADLMKCYHALPISQRIAEVDAVLGADDAETAAKLDRLYSGTKLGSEEERLARFAAAKQVDSTAGAQAFAQASAQDPMLAAALALQPAVLRTEDGEERREGDMLRLRPAYMRALRGYRASQGRAVYPDANATLRVSFGRVQGMDVRDGVHYTPLTTVAGIVEKHRGEGDFNAPRPLLDAIAKGDFGTTADPALNTQTVDFLTNLDTTGGNSGSPVFDADGKLMGLNFDSNWEAVSASWMYDPRYKRAIHVDMRYMRWLMAKVYPAGWLLREMNLPPQ